MKRLKKQFAVLGTALLLCLGLGAVVAPSASAASGTISGDIQCAYGNNQVVGVWVDANTGNDGWASIWSDGYGGVNYSYTLSQSSNYTLHVGCSGTPSNWGATMVTPNVGGNYYNWQCTYTQSMGYFCAMA